MSPGDLNVAIVDSTPQPQQTYLADNPDFQKHAPLQNRMRDRKPTGPGSLRDRYSTAQACFVTTEMFFLLKTSVHLSLIQEYALFWTVMQYYLSGKRLLGP